MFLLQKNVVLIMFLMSSQLLMEKSDSGQTEDEVQCKATLTGDIVGKEFKFDIPFENKQKEM